MNRPHFIPKEDHRAPRCKGACVILTGSKGPNAPPLTSGCVISKGRNFHRVAANRTWRVSHGHPCSRGEITDVLGEHLARSPSIRKKRYEGRGNCGSVKVPLPQGPIGHVSRINGRVTPVHCGLWIPVVSQPQTTSNQKPGCRVIGVVVLLQNLLRPEFFGFPRRNIAVRIVRQGFTIGLRLVPCVLDSRRHSALQ